MIKQSILGNIDVYWTDEDPTSVAIDAIENSWIIYQPPTGLPIRYIKNDTGSTTNVSLADNHFRQTDAATQGNNTYQIGKKSGFSRGKIDLDIIRDSDNLQNSYEVGFIVAANGLVSSTIWTYLEQHNEVAESDITIQENGEFLEVVVNVTNAVTLTVNSNTLITIK